MRPRITIGLALFLLSVAGPARAEFWSHLRESVGLAEKQAEAERSGKEAGKPASDGKAADAVSGRGAGQGQDQGRGAGAGKGGRGGGPGKGGQGGGGKGKH